MAKKLKSVRRFNQNYKNFIFSEMLPVADDEYLELLVEMDNNGNVVTESKFDSEGELEEKNTYTYDTNSKLLSHTLLYVLDDVTEKRILTRNDKGLLVSEVKYYGDESGEKTEYEYNDKENVISITNYDEEGDFVQNEEIIYDEKDSLKERISRNTKGKVLNHVVFHSEENQVLKIEETEYDEKDAIVSKTLVTFNKEGKEVSSVQTNLAGKLISSVLNIYDEHGNLNRKEHKDFYSKTILFQYDEQNRVTTQELMDGTGLLLRKNLYAYDDEGNVIGEQTYEMDTSRGGRDKHFGTRYEYDFTE